MAFDERKRELNRDLDSYLNSIGRRKNRFAFLKKEKKQKREPPKFNDSIEVCDEGKKSFAGSFKDFFANLFSSKKQEEPEDIPVEQLGLDSAPPKQVEPDVSYALEAQEEEEKEKVGWFSRMLVNLGLAKVESYEDEIPKEEEPVSDELLVKKQDLREIARITTQILKGLNADQVKELKENPDFAAFKDILRKYSLIK